MGKKKQALDSLFNTSKISQSTFDYINKDLTDAIIEIETHRKTLADKITARANELENQLKSLEMSLANLEIHFVAGEIGEDPYKYQRNAIDLGLEATKQELSDSKEVLGKLISEAEIPAPPVPPATTEEEIEIEEQVEESVEEPTEERVETPETATEETAEGEAYEEEPWKPPVMSGVWAGKLVYAKRL